MSSLEFKINTSVLRQTYFWLTVLFGVVIAVLSSGFGPTSLALSIVLLVVAIAFPMFLPGHRLVGCAGLLIFYFLVAMATPGYSPIKNKAKNWEVKQNLHAVQLAIERLKSDTDRYPVSVKELVTESGYMPKLPRNPYVDYKGHNQSVTWISDSKSMYPVNETGWPDDPGLIKGDFVYVPQLEDIEGITKVVGYDLIGFGAIPQSKLRERFYPINEAVPVICLSYHP